MTEKEFNEWIRADDELQSIQGSTDEELLNSVWHCKDTSDEDEDDEDEEDIPVTNLEATSAIETLQRYLLRQREDCKSDISSMKIGEVNLFLRANKLKSHKH